jgi:hypothetical protein
MRLDGRDGIEFREKDLAERAAQLQIPIPDTVRI